MGGRLYLSYVALHPHGYLLITSSHMLFQNPNKNMLTKIALVY